VISFYLEIDYELRQIPDRSVLFDRAESMAFEWDMQHAATVVDSGGLPDRNDPQFCKTHHIRDD
jgi:hypothetical protein